MGATEHSQGSTIATGNVGREGVGINPLRGQNNVQGACDMGSFPHELPGYRHVSDSPTRASFEAAWGVEISPESGLRILNMFDAALGGSFKGIYCKGEDIVQSDHNTQHVATDEKVMCRFPLLLTTGRILSRYNVGAQTRRTENNQWHSEDRLEIHPHDAEEHGFKNDDWVGIQSRAGDTVLRATVSERMQPGVIYTTFHFPESGANVITTDNSDRATNCPEYKVTAVQVMPVMQPSTWQEACSRLHKVQQELLSVPAEIVEALPAK